MTAEGEFGMSAFDDPLFLPGEFLGKVRVFPLPNLVLFPHVMQPLRIFEARYRELLEDALAGDGLIAMAALAPGWEQDYEGRPALYPIACLGRITAHCRLPDGAYNVLLLGLQRVRLLRELPFTRPFREAEAELCEDLCPVHSSAKRKVVRQELREAISQVLPALPEAQEQLDQLLGNDMPLGVLTDVMGYILDIGTRQKLSLLAEMNIVRRAELLLKHLSEAGSQSPPLEAPAGCFPPEFSMN